MIVIFAGLFSLGVFFCFDAWTRPKEHRDRGWLSKIRMHIQHWLNAAGLQGISAWQFVGICGGIAFGSVLLSALLFGSLTLLLLALVIGVYAPCMYVNARRKSRGKALHQCWPEAIDLLAGAIRAGDTLAGAIGVIAERGPEPLRPSFRRLATDYRLSGDLSGSLASLADYLADPTADRVVATLTLAHTVGGRDLGRVLRTLSEFLRDDLALHREIQSRQSWTLIAARVSAAAPWFVLLLVATRPEALRTFDSLSGAVVLLGGAITTIVGYRLMVMLGQLPEEPRVIRGGVQ